MESDLGTITKNQHYVPQLLLRNFSTPKGEKLQVFDSTRSKLRATTVGEVLSQNYFYDRDNMIESFLSDRIEGPASAPIKAILADPTRPIEPGNPALLFFIGVQMARTPGAQRELLDFVNAFGRELVEQYAELNGLPLDSLEGVRLRPSDPQAMGRELLLRSTLSRWLLEDLSWHVLINGTDLPFVIADHPVAQYNWYLRDSNDPGYTGITKRGVQIFLPLSPTVTLALVDPSVYKIGEKGSHCTVLKDRQDVELLNSLQFRSRQDFIVFPLSMDASYVQRRCAELPADSLTQVHGGRTDPVPISGDRLSSYVVQWRTQARYERWLTVSKIKRRMAKREIECVDRKPETVIAHRAATRDLFGSLRQEPLTGDAEDLVARSEIATGP